MIDKNETNLFFRKDVSRLMACALNSDLKIPCMAKPKSNTQNYNKK